MGPDPADVLIGTIKAEAARRDVSHSKLAEVLGLSRASMSRRMSGDVEFSAGEVARIAEHLDVPVALLYGDGARHAV